MPQIPYAIYCRIVTASDEFYADIYSKICFQIANLSTQSNGIFTNVGKDIYSTTKTELIFIFQQLFQERITTRASSNK